MIGTYKMREDKISEMKGSARFRFIRALLIIYAIFIIVILLSEDTGMDKVDSFLIMTGLHVAILLLFIVVSSLVHSPIYNTVIEVTEQGLIRSGQELLTVRFAFDEIGSIIPKSNGTILLKAGLSSKFNLYTNKYAFVNEFNILFIPRAIDNYESILKHINQKVK